MTEPIILSLGAVLAGVLLAVVARWRIFRRAVIWHPRTKGRPVASGLPGAQSDSLPYKGSLAGVPLRILLSDRSGPGGVLRDTLMTLPSTRDE
jgi:hypothetical protein